MNTCETILKMLYFDSCDGAFVIAFVLNMAVQCGFLNTGFIIIEL